MRRWTQRFLTPRGHGLRVACLLLVVYALTFLWKARQNVGDDGFPTVRGDDLLKRLPAKTCFSNSTVGCGLSECAEFAPVEGAVPLPASRSPAHPSFVPGKILFFATPDQRNRTAYIGGFRNNLLPCARKCTMTEDPSEAASCPIVVTLIRYLDRDHLPPRVSPSQIHVAFFREPPNHVGHHTDDLRIFDGLFNLTMGYRTDSDFFTPYGHVIRRANPFRRTIAATEEKTKMVAAIVSNCNESPRMKVIKELQKYVQVDVFGRCGMPIPANLEPSRRLAPPHRLLAPYKFYLSFENSVCRDYVTEKLFRILELDDVIPVVLGGADYCRVAPPHSVINVFDFDGVHELAKRLIYLNGNEAEFRRYFEWKKTWTVSRSRQAEVCRMCDLAHGHAVPELASPRVYPSLRRWNGYAAQCDERVYRKYA